MYPKQPKIKRKYKIAVFKTLDIRQGKGLLGHKKQTRQTFLASANCAQRVPKLRAKSPGRTWWTH